MRAWVLLLLVPAANGVVTGARTAVGRALTKVQVLAGGKERSNAQLKDGIASFYDKSSGLWESMWGEHMHHGYYEAPPMSLDEHKLAQVRAVFTGFSRAMTMHTTQCALLNCTGARVPANDV
jgi:hypothetical protein